MSILDKIIKLKNNHVDRRNYFRSIDSHVRFFDYEVEASIVSVLEEVIEIIENQGWTTITPDFDTQTLYGKYFVTVKYKHLPSTYNQVKEARYDQCYHTFVYASNGKPFSSDMEVIAYRPYQASIPLPYSKEVKM